MDGGRGVERHRDEESKKGIKKNREVVPGWQREKDRKRGRSTLRTGPTRPRSV